MARIRGSTFVVVGCGGVGSWAAVMLRRLEDKASRADVGTPKVKCIKRALRQIARWVEVDPRVELCAMYPPLERQPVDLLKYCHEHGIKVFDSIGAGAKCDPTRVQIADIVHTYDPSRSSCALSRLSAHRSRARRPGRWSVHGRVPPFQIRQIIDTYYQSVFSRSSLRAPTALLLPLACCPPLHALTQGRLRRLQPLPLLLLAPTAPAAPTCTSIPSRPNVWGSSARVSARYGAPHLHFACLRSRCSLKAPDDLPIAQCTICPKLRPYDPAHAGRSPRRVMRAPNSERGTSPIAPPPVRHHPLPSPCAYMYNAAAAPILAPLLSPVVRLLLVTHRFRALHLLVPAASNSALGHLVPGYRAPTVRLYSLHMPMHALTAASHLSTPVMTFERRTSKLVL
ncbi:hypothetical protein FB451DRAFT_1574340 [Mycena latifolia]|nr:hypothetical protein FB451DRAFT_1574340 [Mycena latifolia]